MVGGSRPHPSLAILLGKERSQEGDAVWMPEERILTIQRLLLHLKKTKPKLQSSRVSS